MRRQMVEALTRILRRHAAALPAQREDADLWPDELWRALGEAGFTTMLAEPGEGGPVLADGLALAAVAAAHAAPIPLAEMLAASHLVAGCGMESEGQRLTLGVADPGLVRSGDDKRLNGRVARVPWARHCDVMAVVMDGEDGPLLAMVRLADCTIAAGTNLAGEARDDVTFRDAPVIAARPSRTSIDSVSRLGALFRAAQLAGSLGRVTEIAIEHAVERRQFGRPLAKFQAVEHLIAQLGGHHAAATAAVDLAASAGDLSDISLPAAKIRAGEAAGAGAAIAHQILGAIGYTREHELQSHSRRIWSWRDEFGTEAAWSRRVGELVCAAGGDVLWPTLSAVS